MDGSGFGAPEWHGLGNGYKNSEHLLHVDRVEYIPSKLLLLVLAIKFCCDSSCLFSTDSLTVHPYPYLYYKKNVYALWI